MAPISQQIREDALRVSDSLAVLEATEVPGGLSRLLAGLDDEALLALLADAATARAHFELVITAGAGVVSERSNREFGYQGLAARRGQRSTAGVLQTVTGSTRAEAWRQVRLGEAMAEADAATQASEAAGSTGGLTSDGADDLTPGSTDASGDGSTEGGVDGTTEEPNQRPIAPTVELPWHDPITRAVAERTLTPAGASALLGGLGQPTEHCDSDALREAAEELLANAAGVNADELAKRARWLRDRLDQIGAAERAKAHFDARKARVRTNSTGARTVWMEFDDDSAAWLDSIIDAGMRPRRGGPRFVDKAEAERAEQLRTDPRTDEQLVFDLLVDAMRTGALADPATVYGSRQPGVRVVITQENLNKRDREGNLIGTGHWEDTGETVPAETIERLLCDTGTRPITVDEDGCPLDVGREQRLFTSKQRVALAIRDGGCMHPDCDRPPSYTESHHINEWHADHGRTDIADGLLLCRFHHMLLHNQHWKIRRQGSVYWLVPPVGDPRAPIRLHRKAAWWHGTRKAS
ncbi:MAG: HNH endonuclease [Microbacteriaceae bacterium]|nr:MAG: HNH endonuclease [Microbacteriaceae bacterium]